MQISTVRRVLQIFFLSVSSIGLSWTQPGVAQSNVVQPDLSQVLVSAASLRKHVFLLASDSLQGRMTGTPGQVQASLYCTRLFRQHHLAPIFQLDSSTRSFRQQYPFLISDITRYGPPKGFPSLPSTYKRYELLPPPATDKDSAKALYSHNVAALLVGTDLKQQVVVISAHYDHLGQEGNRIYHGADDNASGTASVLAIAALFDSLAQQGIRSRMSILFVLFSGEEGGLIGSQHFMLNCPIPLDQFVCDLNVDMVGRVDDDHQKSPIIATSSRTGKAVDGHYNRPPRRRIISRSGCLSIRMVTTSKRIRLSTSIGRIKSISPDSAFPLYSLPTETIRTTTSHPTPPIK